MEPKFTAEDQLTTLQTLAQQAEQTRQAAEAAARVEQQALNSYAEALEINPESPARQTYEMVIRILDFYNKDMFNQ